jgi:aminoglycoside phosphotransferase (APT) family kinase protein
MPLPARPDLMTRRPALERWLATKAPDAETITVTNVSGTAGAGFVNETLLFDVDYTRAGVTTRAGYVLRVQPSEYTVFYRAADAFEPQYRLMALLAEQTDIPVPAVRWYESDPSFLGAPFFVMDKVEGRTQPDVPPYFLSGWLHDATAEEQENLWWASVETLAAINATDWPRLGLDFLCLEPGATPGFDQRLAYYDSAFEWARGDTQNDVVAAAREWLLDNRPATPEPVALCWGDARIGNMIYRGFDVAAVIDWEMASLGPPLQDLGWWFFMHRAFFGDTFTEDSPVGLPGFPRRDTTLARWSDLTGYPIDLIDYHEVFAGYRMSVHLQRMGTLFVKHGAVAPDSGWPHNNLATQALAPLIGVEHPEPEPLPSILGG